VPAAVQQAVARAFLGMHADPKGRDILQQVSSQVGLSAEAYFIGSDGAEYGTYRDFYRTAPPSLR
jgi:phosphonate transport system substrate-binding protein